MISKESFQHRINAMTTSSCRGCVNKSGEFTTSPTNNSNNYTSNTGTTETSTPTFISSTTSLNNAYNNQHHRQHPANTTATSVARKSTKSNRNRKRDGPTGHCKPGKRNANRQRYVSQTRNVHDAQVTKSMAKLSEDCVDNDRYQPRCPFFSDNPYLEHGHDEYTRNKNSSSSPVDIKTGFDTDNSSLIFSQRPATKAIKISRPVHQRCDIVYVDQMPTTKPTSVASSVKIFDNRLNVNAAEFQSREFNPSPSPPLAKPNGLGMPISSEMAANFMPPGNSIITTMVGMVQHSGQFNYPPHTGYDMSTPFSQQESYIPSDGYISHHPSYDTPVIGFIDQYHDDLPHDCTCIPQEDSVLVSQSRGKAVVSVGDISDDPADILCDACLSRQQASLRLARDDFARLTTVALDLTGYDTVYSVLQPEGCEEGNIYTVDYSAKISRSRQVVRRMNSVQRLSNTNTTNTATTDEVSEPVASECRFLYTPHADNSFIDYAYENNGDSVIMNTYDHDNNVDDVDDISLGSDGETLMSSSSSSPVPTACHQLSDLNSATVAYDSALAEYSSFGDVSSTLQQPRDHPEIQDDFNLNEQFSFLSGESGTMGYVPESLTLHSSVRLNEKAMSMLPAQLADQC